MAHDVSGVAPFNLNLCKLHSFSKLNSVLHGKKAICEASNVVPREREADKDLISLKTRGSRIYQDILQKAVKSKMQILKANLVIASSSMPKDGQGEEVHLLRHHS